MPSLDVGGLFATVDILTEPFDRKYALLVRKFGTLGEQAVKASEGVGVLDNSLARSAAAADKVAVSQERATRVTVQQSSASTRAAATTQEQAAAMARLDAVMASVAGSSGRVQQATLREATVRERLTVAERQAAAAKTELASASRLLSIRQVSESTSAAELAAAETRVARAQTEATASTTRLAAAQATAIGAQRSLAAASTQTAVAATRGSSGLLKSARDLGLLFGAFEIVKKGIDITQEANSFQASMTRIETVVGASKSEVNGMSDALLKMAGPVAQAPDELAKSLYHMEAIGLRGAKALDATRIAAQGAKIGNADLEDTTNALTSTIASGITKGQGFRTTMAQILTIVGTGDMKLQDFNDTLSSGLLTILKNSGVSLRDTGAALAVFGDNNIRGANAATMLRVAVQALQSPAKGGAKALASIGLGAHDLSNALQKGGLNAAITLLRKHLIDSGMSGKKAGALIVEAFGKKANAGIGVLIGQYSRLQMKYGELDKNSANFGKRWEQTTKTAAFALSSLGHQIESAGITLTGKLAPALATSATWLATTIPNAIGTTASILGPFVHIVGVGLVGAWHAVSAVLGVAGGALSGIAGFLAHNKALVTGVTTAVLTMWAAFKAYQIARFALVAMVVLINRVGAAAGLMAARSKASFASMSTGAQAMRAGMAVAAIGVGLVAAAWQINSQRTAEAKQRVEEYTAALNQSKGAIDASVRSTLIQKLASDGAYDAAKKYGVAQKDVTDAALGSIPAMHRIMIATNGNYDAVNAVTFAVNRQGGALNEAQRHYRQAAAQTKEHTDAQTKDTAAAKAQASSIGASASALLTAKAAAAQNAAQVRQQTLQYQLANDAASLFAQTLAGLAGIPLGTAQAQTALASANLAVADSFKQNGSAIDGASKAAVANQQALEGQAQSAQAAAEQVGRQTHSSTAAVKSFKDSRDAIIEQTRAQGKLTPAVQAFIDKLYNLKNLKVPPTKLDADTTAGEAKMKALQERLDSLKQNKIPGLDANSEQGIAEAQRLQAKIDALHGKGIPLQLEGAQAVIASLGQIKNTLDYLGAARSVDIGASGRGAAGLASGGSLPEGVSAVGEEGAELIVKRGPDVQVISHPRSVPIAAGLAARGVKVPGFAGGTEGSIIAFARSQLGTTLAGAAGIAGNAKIESGFNTSAYNSGEGAIGLFQWEGGRRTALQQYAGSRNLSETSLTAQLGFLKHELTSGGYGGLLKILRTTGSGRDAAAAFDGIFERSSGSSRGARESAASSILSQLKAGGFAGASAPSGYSGSGSSGSGGGIVNGTKYATALGYQNAQRHAAMASAEKAAEHRAAQVKAVGGTISGANKLGSTIHGNVQIVGGHAVNNAAHRSDVQQQLWDTEAQLRAAGASRKFIQNLTDENKAILRHVGLRNHAASRLVQANARLVAAQKTLHDDRVKYRSAVTGSLDITTLGQGEDGRVTAGSALAASHQAVTRAKAFVSVMHKLIGLKIFPPRFLRALLEQGPAGLPEAQAYASMNPGQLKSLAADNSQLYALGKTLAGDSTTRLDKPAVIQAAAGQKFWQEREQKRQHELNVGLENLGKQFQTAIGNLHLGGKVKMDWRHGELYLAVENDKSKVRHRGKTRRTKAGAR